MKQPESDAAPMPGEHYRSLAALADGYFWHWTRRRLLLECARASAAPFDAYLDVGCGLGLGTLLAARDLVASRLARPGLVTVGLDHPAVGATERLTPAGRFVGVDFDAADCALGPLPGGGPALVSCMDVLEHLRQPAALASSIAGALRPGDLALFTVPAGAWLWSDWDVRLGHLRRYSRAGLVRELAGAGLEVVRSGHLFSWAVLPGLWRARRKQAGGTEFPAVSPLVNAALKAAGRLELLLSRVARVPIGTSAWALARRSAAGVAPPHE